MVIATRGPRPTGPDDDRPQRSWLPNKPPPIWRWPPLQRLLYDRAPAVLGVVVLVLPCLWPLPPLYYFGRSAHLAAWRMLRVEDRGRVHDRAVTRVKRLRMWSGPAVSLVLLLSFGTTHDVKEELNDRWVALFAGPWLLIATAPAVVAVLIATASPHRRSAMRAALRGPLRQFGRFVGTLGVPYGFITLVTWLIYYGEKHGGASGWLWLLLVLAIAWTVFLTLFASLTVVQTGFGLYDVHPTLPALLTSVLVWECAALGGLPGGPPMMAYALLLGGPATVTAIGWWEIHRLRTWYGVTLRDG